jgi:hypothetical protein
MRVIDALGRDLAIELPANRLPSGERLRAVVEYGMDPGPTMPSSGNAGHRECFGSAMRIPPEEFRIAADTYLLVLSLLFGVTFAVEEVCSHYRSHYRDNVGRGTAAQRAADIFAGSDLTFTAVALELSSRGVLSDPARWRSRNPEYRRVEALAVEGDGRANGRSAELR